MKNIPIKNENGKTDWISRSCATETIVFNKVNDEWCVLANKRGKACLNNVGYWNVPAGFLEYNETLEDCSVRKTFEETGVKINKNQLNLFEVNSECNDEKMLQTVVICYWTMIHGTTKLTNENCVKDKVDELKWIPIIELEKYNWISNDHLNRIKKSFIACANKNLCEKRYKS